MDTGNLAELLLASTEDRPAIRFPSGDTTSYPSLRCKVAAIALALRAAGFGKGDRIAFRGKKSETALAFYLACLSNGLVYVPVNTSYARDEVAYFLQDSEPAALFVDHLDAETSSFVNGLPAPRVIEIDAGYDGKLWTSPSKFQPVRCDANDLAALLYTSGTTGRPKGAMITHASLIANTQTLVEAWRFSASDIVLHALPMFHGHGLFIACHVPLAAGSSILLAEKFDVDLVLALLSRSTVFMGVPTLYGRLLQSARFEKAVSQSIRLFISGSAPLPTDLFERVRERTGYEIVERFGTTETSICTTNPVEGERRPGTVGKPLAGVDIRLVNDDGLDAPDGEVGRVAVRGPNVFAGYWKRTSERDRCFTSSGHFLTGDLARKSSDGYITIVGRDKDMIISGGFNVYAAEVESVILRVPGVADCAVIGSPHPDFGEAVVAVVVGAPGHTLEQGMIVETTRNHLASFKTPKSVVFVDELPKNAMGKVLKHELRGRFASIFVSRAN